MSIIEFLREWREDNEVKGETRGMTPDLIAVIDAAAHVARGLPAPSMEEWTDRQKALWAAMNRRGVAAS